MDILIADRHTLVRRSLKEQVLSRQPRANVIETSTISEIHEALASKTPGAMILELLLADGNAFACLAAWRREHPRTDILVYSMAARHFYAARALALGCIGFIHKDDPETQLTEALNRLFPLDGKPGPLRQAPAPSNGHATATSPFEHLSDRELLVMQDLLDDHGIKEISQRMDLSPSTVATYKSRLFAKMGVSSVTELRRLSEIQRLSEQG